MESSSTPTSEKVCTAHIVTTTSVEAAPTFFVQSLLKIMSIQNRVQPNAEYYE